MAGWLGLYAEEADVPLLLERLNEDPEIAFLVPEGPGCWRAMWRVDELLGKTMLWHVPGGSLPLLGRDGQDTVIEDPFAGWREVSAGLDDSVPYFGPGLSWTLLLELYARGWRGLSPDLIPLSGLSWYGRTRLKGSPDPTRQWWSRFRDWMRRRTVRVTRSGPLDGRQADIWAMPAALHAIQSGVARSEWPLVRGG